MKKVIFIIVLILLLVAFGVSAVMVGNYLVGSKEQANRNEELVQMVEDAKNPTQTETLPGESAPAETAQETLPAIVGADGMLTEYAGLYELNKDMVGWLEIPNTKLKYPVMQTPTNPNYYLKHDFDKQKSDWGAVYAWETANITEPSDNITLFGHNMKDGSMFATLNNYENKYFWEDNKIILFNTMYEYHTYKIFAVFKTTATLDKGFSYHQFVDAADEAAFNEFVSTCKSLSLYDTEITPVYGDKLICLSTCAYHTENGRLVVAAVRIT